MSSTSTTEIETCCVSRSPEATSFPLLELPRELRERIYIAVLRMSASPPPFPVSMADRVLGSQDVGEYREYCNMYPLFPLPSTTLTLLTLNRQVHAEVREVISRKEIMRPLIYKLDCIIVHERRLYPTWLSIPALSSRVDVVEANFRLFGDVNGGYSDWTPGHGSPGALVWNLLELLKRFLKRGPDCLSPPKSSMHGVKIGELVLNVVTPEEPPEGFIPVEPYFFGAFGIKHEGLVHPETIVREMKEGIWLLWRTYHAKPVFRESVEIIRVCLDGKEMGRWDVKGRTD